MKLFLHDNTRIRIVNDTAGWQEWQGTPAEFLALEPDYPGLPEGMIVRYQTEERQYLQDADGVQSPDAFNALPYCENIGSYPAWTPEDPESLINDAMISTDYTWSSDKIEEEIASVGPTSETGLACDGRLTLTTGVAVTTSDVTAAATVYFTPYKGNRIALYFGSTWELRTFTELSLSLSGATANKNSDIFVYDNSGTLALSREEWTDDTTRATALVLQDGGYVKSGSPDYRYIGTIRTTSATGQTEDSLSKRYVWNYYNRVPRILSYKDTTTSWTYNSTTWQQLRGQSGARVDCVLGVIENHVFAWHVCVVQNLGYIGIGVNSTSAITGPAAIFAGTSVSGGSVYHAVFTLPRGGFNSFYPLQRSSSGGITATFYGVREAQQTSFFSVILTG